MGYAFLYNGAVVSWASKKQRHVATSTVEAECVAFHLAAQHAVWLQQLLHEMVDRKGPVIINCDSTGCISNLKNPITSSHTKHIDVRFHRGRELVVDHMLVPKYISTEENVADVCTKPLVNVKFSNFVSGLGMT
jgi:hypothetical protein